MPFEVDFLKGNDETKRIEFEGGAWVEIRTAALMGDKKAITLEATSGEDTDMEFNVGRFQAETLYRRIVAWSSPRKITRAAIEEMPEEMSDRIFAEIDALSTGRSDDQKKVSMTSASPTSSRAERRRGRVS